MPHRPEQALGTCLVLVVLLDVFLTVLYARIGTGIISDRLARLTWRLLLGPAKLSGPRNSATVLSFCGPVILVLLVLAWALGLTVGTALVMHPDLGTSIRAGSGDTPAALVAAPHAAAASALVGAARYGSGMVGSALVGVFADGTPWPVGWVIAASGLGSAACAWLLLPAPAAADVEVRPEH